VLRVDQARGLPGQSPDSDFRCLRRHDHAPGTTTRDRRRFRMWLGGTGTACCTWLNRAGSLDRRRLVIDVFERRTSAGRSPRTRAPGPNLRRGQRAGLGGRRRQIPDARARCGPSSVAGVTTVIRGVLDQRHRCHPGRPSTDPATDGDLVPRPGPTRWKSTRRHRAWRPVRAGLVSCGRGLDPDRGKRRAWAQTWMFHVERRLRRFSNAAEEGCIAARKGSRCGGVRREDSTDPFSDGPHRGKPLEPLVRNLGVSRETSPAARFRTTRRRDAW